MTEDSKQLKEEFNIGEKVFMFGVYGFSFALPLSLQLNTFFLWVILLGWLTSKKWIVKLSDLKGHLIPIILFFLFFTQLILNNSQNLSLNNLKIIELPLSLIIFPILIYSSRKNSIKSPLLLLNLGVGISIAMLISWVDIGLDVSSKQMPFEQLKYLFEWIYTDANLFKTLSFHPSYFAIILVMFVVNFWFSNDLKSIKKNKLLFVLISIFLCVFLIETASRIAIISFVILFLLLVMRNLTLKKIAVIFVVFLGLFLLVVNTSYFKYKITKIYNTEDGITFERYHRWQEILEENSNEGDLFLGVSVEKSKEIYINSYTKGGFDLAAESNYNAHNLFIEILVKNGVFGLFIFMLLLAYFFQNNRKNKMALVFLFLCIAFAFTESYLERAKGMYFFMFFYVIFTSKVLKLDNEK